jgi:hypothetical protein
MIINYSKNLKLLFLLLTIANFLVFFLLPLTIKPAQALNDSMPVLQIPIPNLTFSKPVCDQSGNTTICNVNWIGEYIAGIYKYAIGVVGILAAIVLMIGGVLWVVAGGSATMIGEAKAWIGASLTGLVIALCSYLILYQVNPALVSFNALGVSQISAPQNALFAQNCQSTDIGECAVQKMVLAGFAEGEKSRQASAICMAESGGNVTIMNKTTKCSNTDGEYYAVWGLFQFNLSANNFYSGYNADTFLRCSAAFDKAWSNSSPTCEVVDINLYNRCVEAAKDPSINRKNAVKLVNSRSWKPWETNKNCKF